MVSPWLGWFHHGWNGRTMVGMVSPWLEWFHLGWDGSTAVPVEVVEGIFVCRNLCKHKIHCPLNVLFDIQNPKICLYCTVHYLQYSCIIYCTYTRAQLDGSLIGSDLSDLSQSETELQHNYNRLIVIKQSKKYIFFKWALILLIDKSKEAHGLMGIRAVFHPCALIASSQKGNARKQTLKNRWIGISWKKMSANSCYPKVWPPGSWVAGLERHNRG